MKLVALVRWPTAPDARQRVAQILVARTGATVAEANMRLAPEPPAVLARVEDDAAALVAAIRETGAGAVAVEPAAPAQKARFAAHAFQLGEALFTLTQRGGQALAMPYDQIVLVLRGKQVATRTSTVTVREARVTMDFDGLGAETIERDERTSKQSEEHFVRVFARVGQVAALEEGRTNFTGLPKLALTRPANLDLVCKELRLRAPGAFYDDRLLRLGKRALPFVMGREVHVASGSVSTSASSTAEIVDVMAEVLYRAALEGLLGG